MGVGRACDIELRSNDDVPTLDLISQEIARRFFCISSAFDEPYEGPRGADYEEGSASERIDRYFRGYTGHILYGFGGGDTVSASGHRREHVRRALRGHCLEGASGAEFRS